MSTPQISMRVSQFVARIQYFLMAVLILSTSSHVVAQDSHAMMPQNQGAADQQNKGALIKIVRQATNRFHDVKVAEAEGYVLTFGCVSGDDQGAMGLHYINFDLVKSDVIDARRPQAIIYEPTANGGVKLIGADYLVLANTWNKHHAAPPDLMGQWFHYFETPNRFGLPAFYTLHVWAWKDNPNGAFVNWHPNVSCQQYAGTANSNY
jgi:hypothetical protein